MALQPHEKIDASEEIGVNPTPGPSIGDIIEARLSRRGVIQSALVASAAAAVGFGPTGEAAAASVGSFAHAEVKQGIDATHHVPDGYQVDVVIRWGDAVLADAPKFDPNNLSAAAQEKQFGYNNDFIGYFPLPLGSQNSSRGILTVNHEYVLPSLMWAGLDPDHDKAQAQVVDKARNEVALAAHGMSFIEVARNDQGRWAVVPNSRYARRLTGNTTEFVVTGPARGHDLLKTSADRTGTVVIGTLNNCAGGWTPWGTVLTAEENFNGYFGGDPDKLPHAEMYKRYGVTKASWYGWWQSHERFNVEKEPNESHRFGYMVEIDPYDPNSTPKKRTALGRFKHEGGSAVVNRDGRVVVYMGDDERFDYVYKFVTEGRFDPNNRSANMDLLDRGTLYAAKFNADGSLEWLPLVAGQGPLTAAAGFPTQAEVCIFTRKAADLVGATKMDRPEDVEVNPANGRIYAMLTNNSRRTAAQVDKANPRADNRHGHVIEMIPDGGDNGDHASTRGRWEVFLLAGKPGEHAGTAYHAGISENGWLSCPDNVAFDSKGRMFIATDGAPSAAKTADGIWTTDVTGEGRAFTKRLFAAPTGAEVCGPKLTPDDRTLFLAIQHPGEDKGSSFEKPSTRWPDFADGMPPRPAVIAITKRDNGVIGS